MGTNSTILQLLSNLNDSVKHGQRPQHVGDVHNEGEFLWALREGICEVRGVGERAGPGGSVVLEVTLQASARSCAVSWAVPCPRLRVALLVVPWLRVSAPGNAGVGPASVSMILVLGAAVVAQVPVPMPELLPRCGARVPFPQLPSHR